MQLSLKSPFISERIEEWAYWIVEREAMRVRREKLPDNSVNKIFSKDPVMARTRWCNVRRMDDKVSRWLMKNWYPKKTEAEYWAKIQPRMLIVAGLAARMINKPETLTYITEGAPCYFWNYETYRERMYEVKEMGEPVFTNAYIINGASGGPKIEQVLNAMRKCYETKPFHYLDTSSMRATAHALHTLPGVGSFIAGQVVADLRHVLDFPRKYWLDRMDWAPPGPGSSRGMKYLLGLSGADDMAGRGKDLSEKQFLQYLPRLMEVAQKHPKIKPIFEDRKLEAHDIQNTLCELSKYVRVKHGGHAKNKYPPR